jgi:PadR family transcriptional regulator, regulatory protein PadR
MKPDLIRGHLDMLLLSIVADGPIHGYAAMEELKQRSGGTFDLPEGTVYPALHRLESAGLLASGWSTETGRRRRVYEITTRGRASLATEQQEFATLVAGVEALLRGAPWRPTT